MTSASMRLRLGVLKIRADMMAALRDRIQKNDWTQIEAAEKLKVGALPPRRLR